MTECNAIIKANNEIDKLKRENKKLNESCVQYGFDMGELREENEQLKSKNRGLQSELQIFKEDVTHSNLQINKLADENEQLKKEIVKFKEREKHIRDVKKEVLDRVFKMSIYEITDAFEYYRKRIKELQENN